MSTYVCMYNAYNTFSCTVRLSSAVVYQTNFSLVVLPHGFLYGGLVYVIFWESRRWRTPPEL